jgi:hypothetical protein
MSERPKYDRKGKPRAAEWTQAEIDTAYRLFSENAPKERFLAEIGRTKSAATAKRSNIRSMEEQRRRAAEGLRRYEPRSEQVEDACRRASAPRSLTAWAFGDPAPGQSALDLRMQGGGA